MIKMGMKSSICTALTAMALVSMPVLARAGFPGDFDGNGTVSISEVQTVINAFLGLIPNDTAAPSVPANLAAAPVSSTQIRLTWSAATDNVGVVGYKVYRGSTRVGTVQSPTFMDSGLAAGTTYSYTVAAFDASGNSSANSLPATSFTELGTAASKLVGSWYVPYPNGGQAKGPIVFNFIDGQNFMMSHDGDVTADPSGQPGMEHGTYTWNQATGAFTAAVTSDTNGQWGFSNPEGGMVLILSADGNAILDPDTGAVFASRVVQSSTNPLIGGWYIPASSGGPATVTFVDDSNFMTAVDGTADSNGHPGIERGTYTWNQATGVFTPTVTVNTDGAWGLSNPDGPITATVSSDGNTLTVNAKPFAMRIQ